MINVITAGLFASLLALGLTGAAQASERRASSDEVNHNATTLETFRLADRSNLKRLSNGDFLFRIARERATGVVYWAYMGSTRHVIATVPDLGLLADDTAARRILLRIADLPTRAGCGVGLIHQSMVYVVPEDVRFGKRGIRPDVRPLYAKGEVRNDTSDRMPTQLLSYERFKPGNETTGGSD